MIYAKPIRLLLFLLPLLCLAGAHNAARAAVNEIQALDFGKWFIGRNDGVYSVTVQTNGGYSSSPELVMLEGPPAPGIYEISGLPEDSEIVSVDVTVSDPMTLGGSASLSIGAFQVIAPDTDENGVTTVTLGATVQTSGNGTSYGNGTHIGELTLEFNF